MLVPCFFKSAWTHLWLTPHSAAVLMECTSDSSVFLQVLTASAARGRHAALGRDGGVVGGRPAGTQVLLREPPVPQRLVRSAAHRRGQRHRTPQRTVLPTRQDCERKEKKNRHAPWDRAVGIIVNTNKSGPLYFRKLLSKASNLQATFSSSAVTKQT